MPSPALLAGRHVALEPIDPARHASALHEAFAVAPESLWTYLPYGPFEFGSLHEQLQVWSATVDPQFYAVVDRTSGPVGWSALQRFDADSGSVEVAHVCFSPALQRSSGGTEAMWLLMRRIFSELGYRRYEWKCDALNAPSRSAAERLGFRFEGVFRNHTVYRGRNRDTAWYSIVDDEWPALDRAFRAWLAPANHRAGRQLRPLGEFMSDV